MNVVFFMLYTSLTYSTYYRDINYNNSVKISGKLFLGSECVLSGGGGGDKVYNIWNQN